jgi:uncharacterized ferritin-like protein (DUF455 family)
MTPHAPGTVERWAWDYVLSTDLSHKRSPPPPPSDWETHPESRHLPAPGRPAELVVISRAPKARAVGTPEGRARVLHTFFHHELQAAELMAWAVLRFPDSPEPLRRGLMRILLDEVRHMGLYAGHIERLGFSIGSFPVRDWFWERVPMCANIVSFVATMSLGFEGANLEHSMTFAERFRAAGDDAGAEIQERVGREEIAHVRFGAHWFAELQGGLSFEAWRAALPKPLSPTLMRGKPIARDLRRMANMPEGFLDELDAWQLT